MYSGCGEEVKHASKNVGVELTGYEVFIMAIGIHPSDFGSNPDLKTVAKNIKLPYKYKLRLVLLILLCHRHSNF